jgi:AraC-like DNA-binding protein
MAHPEAHTFFQDFDPEPPQVFQMDRHYLLYAFAGAMRLEALGQSWSLPPARAALITAGEPITVSLPQKMTVCSVLFDAGFVPPPPRELSVFDMSPLARELVLETRDWGQRTAPLSDYARQMYLTLAQVAWRLSERPSPLVMPVAKSRPVALALAMMDAQMASDLTFGAVAAGVAATPRSLARKFSGELGMTFGQALRRIRIVKAVEELARSDAPVTEIALTVGYGSLSAFNLAFRELTGQTPTLCRSNFRSARVPDARS